MEAKAQGFVGPAGIKLADGTKTSIRMGITGGFIGTPVNGRYCEGSTRQRQFTVCNTGSTAVQLNNPNATGLILYNPPGSGVNFAILEVEVALAGVAAGPCPLILTGNVVPSNAQTTITTALTITPTLAGSAAASAAKAGSVAVMPSATIVRAIGGSPVAASSINTQLIKDEVAGALVLTPNTAVSLQSLSNQVGVVASFTWAEIPI